MRTSNSKQKIILRSLRIHGSQSIRTPSGYKFYTLDCKSENLVTSFSEFGDILLKYLLKVSEPRNPKDDSNFFQPLDFKIGIGKLCFVILELFGERRINIGSILRGSTNPCLYFDPQSSALLPQRLELLLLLVAGPGFRMENLR